MQFQEAYSKYYDLLNQAKPYKKEIEFIYKWACKPETIFDIGAGTASYWKYYPKNTILFGIDKSEDMVKQSCGRVSWLDITLGTLPWPPFDCATALFDVMNYIPLHDWWRNIPLKSGGYFIFDLWHKEKVDAEGFKTTIKRIEDVTRIVKPLGYDGKKVRLEVWIGCGKKEHTEIHEMYVYSFDDIKRFCGKDFEIVDTRSGKDWQMWMKLRRL
mgnify:FL=1